MLMWLNRCMRRLQTNLSCLAALADRKTTVPPDPLVTPPPLNLSITLRVPQSPGADSAEKSPDPAATRGERAKIINELYQKLQSLFPHVDPRKELAAPTANQGAKGPNGQATTGGQDSNHGSPAPGAPGSQIQRTPQMGHVPTPMLQPQLAGS